MLKKIKRCIGILSKIRYFVSQQVLVQLYDTLIYPFLAYGLYTRENVFVTGVCNPLFGVQLGLLYAYVVSVLPLYILR